MPLLFAGHGQVIIAVMLALLSFSDEALAKPSAKYIVGVQDINYYPHFNFNSSTDKGFAWALLEEFAAASGYQFVYRTLPVKRLQIELHNAEVDFVYPDSPRWSDQSATVVIRDKLFSEPLATAMAGTMVSAKRAGEGLKDFTTVAVPFGFSAVNWMELHAAGAVTFIGVPDAAAALRMVRMGRADGADIEYHVARYLQQSSPGPSSLTLDLSLPYGIVAFRLSTLVHGEVIEQLNAFLNEESDVVDELKRQYQLHPPQSIVNQYGPPLRPSTNQ